MELAADTTTTITMERTVPIGLQTCSDLSFQYDHADSGVAINKCQAFFKEDRPEHPITVRVEPTPGCRSYSSLLEFKPYSKPGGRMWENYVPQNITVRSCLKKIYTRTGKCHTSSI